MQTWRVVCLCRSTGWGLKPEIGAAALAANQYGVVSVGQAEQLTLSIKSREDKEIKVPGLRADAHKSTAIASQGLVEM